MQETTSIGLCFRHGPFWAAPNREKKGQTLLAHPTQDKLLAMKLTGMAKALAEQLTSDLYANLSFEERVGLLVDREMTERDNRRLKKRLENAKLRQTACLEDLDYKPRRGLDRAVIQQLSSCQWVRKAQNVFITGPTGVGKTYLACALAQKACREELDGVYHRAPLLLRDLSVAKGDGRYKRVLASLSKKRLLIMDDWGLAPLNDEQRRDLLELVEERYGRTSTIIVSQVPVDQWHQSIGDPTLADAILDRIIHNAYQITLQGETMRKRYATIPEISQEGGDKNSHLV